MPERDLEMLRACADAMGIKLWVEGGNQIMDRLVSTGIYYDPLHNDAQAMCLVKKCHLSVMIWDELDGHKAGWWRVDGPHPNNITYRHADLNRAICETVALMQKAK